MVGRPRVFWLVGMKWKPLQALDWPDLLHCLSNDPSSCHLLSFPKKHKIKSNIRAQKHVKFWEPDGKQCEKENFSKKKFLKQRKPQGHYKSKPPQFSGTSLPLHSFHALVWQQHLTKPRLLFRCTGFVITTLLTNSTWVLRKNRWYNDNNKSRWQGSTKDTEVTFFFLRPWIG